MFVDRKGGGIEAEAVVAAGMDQVSEELFNRGEAFFYLVDLTLTI